MENHSFSWKAMDQKGRILKGTWELSRESDVRTQLFSLGYFPLEIFQKRLFFHSLIAFVDRVNKKSDWVRIWAGLTRRLSLLLQAGIPLLQAVEILGEQDKSSRFSQHSWDSLKEMLESGVEFSEAMKFLEPEPTPYIQAMIQAGEQAGRMPEILVQISLELEEEFIYRRKLVSAYSYPTFLFLLALGVIYALNILVLPVYKQIFTNLEAELPLLTQVVFKVSGLIPIGVSMIILLPGAVFFIIRLRYPGSWREVLGNGFSYIPILGRIYRLNDCVQFSHVLGTLLDAGIPLLDALNLTKGTVRTYSMKHLIGQLGVAARAGKRIAPLLRHSKAFPLEAFHMLRVGEESGQLSEMLRHMAKMFRLDLEDQMEKIPRILGPSLIVLLSALIGLVAVGVLLPIFDVGTHLDL
jgi:type IV pilus assembly protein PilC